MADTVNNHGVIIATEGTGHIARAKPASDVCLIPGIGATIPANNFIATSQLSSGKTTKTLINNHAIWTKAGKLDKSPSMAPHAGTLGGVVDSGAYLLHAWPMTYSKDVLVESNGVVRTNDQTHQNRSNTFGSVDGSAAHPEEDALSDAFKKRCTIVLVEGEEVPPPGVPAPKGGVRKFGPPPPAKAGIVAGIKSIPRKAGVAVGLSTNPVHAPPPAAASPAPPKEATYLGVYSGSKIKLDATRQDATTAAKLPAKCTIGTHTYWTAVTTGNMFWVLDWKDTIQDHVGDHWDLVLPGGKSNIPKFGDAKRDKPTFEGPGRRDAKRESSQRDYEQKKAARQAGATLPVPGAPKTNFALGLEIGLDLAKAYRIWKLYESPPTCTITARACGGAKQLKLQIYPEDPFEFDLFSDSIKSALAFIKGVAKCVEWVGRTFRFPFKFEFLQKPNVKLKIAYKELAEDKNGFIRQQVRPAWSFVFAFAPFLKASIGVQVPLTTLIAAIGNTMAPGAATAVMSTIQWCLDKLGCKANVLFQVTLELAPEIKLTVDEYDDTFWDAKSEAKLVLTFSVAIELAWPSFSIKVESYFENNIVASDWARSADADKLLEFKVKGYIQLGIKGSIIIDFFKWVIKNPVAKNFDWKPTFLRFPEGAAADFGTRYIPMPKSGQTAAPDPVKTE
jgi:hypothetical protein